jgi:DNA-binding LytR/AlgR family response regulator
MAGLTVLAVDDEEHALRDLEWLLSNSADVDEVVATTIGVDALRVLNERPDIDAIFLDVQMPGLDGVELAKIVRNFKRQPAIAFVTAFEHYAVDAFDLDVCDYLLKPVEELRLHETLRRVRSRVSSSAAGSGDATLARLIHRSGGQTKIIERGDVAVVEAAGDYVRVHVGQTSYLVRQAISTLANAWAAAGFVRIHRSYLVRSELISEVRVDGGHRSVILDGRELPVSRRYARLLQAHLDRAS